LPAIAGRFERDCPRPAVTCLSYSRLVRRSAA
jgi:hypothetical protein